MIRKICSKCGIEKDLDCFNVSAKGKYKRHSICKECKNKMRKENKRKKQIERVNNLIEVENLDGEVWKDIKGYEGYYQVSNLGRVKSLSRVRHTGTGDYITEEKLLSQKKRKTGNPNLNYYQVSLYKNSIAKLFSPHRLVAEAFIENPNNKPYINHKDGNGRNNRAENLEWVTNKENQEHAKDILNHTHTLSVAAFNKKTKQKEYEFNSMSDAARWLLENNMTQDATCLTGIIKCCKHKIPSYLGYVWEYKEEGD